MGQQKITIKLVSPREKYRRMGTNIEYGEFEIDALCHKGMAVHANYITYDGTTIKRNGGWTVSHASTGLSANITGQAIRYKRDAIAVMEKIADMADWETNDPGALFYSLPMEIRGQVAEAFHSVELLGGA